MARVSKQLLANRLKFAAEATGHRVAKSWNDVGGLQLGQQYGGVQIEMVSNPGGGIHTIGPRMRATDMADALQIVSELHYFAKKNAQVLENPPRFSRRAPSKKAMATFTDAELQHMIRVTTGGVKDKYLAEAGRRVAEEMTRGRAVARKRYGAKNLRRNPRGHGSVFSGTHISMAKLKKEISDLVRGGHIGFSVRLKDGEYKLQEYRNGKPYGTGYFTNDAQDVIDTARAIRERYDRIDMLSPRRR